MKYISRILRRQSLQYAHCFQTQMFKIYIDKYIKKFQKLLTPNAIEHPELLDHIKKNQIYVDDLLCYINHHKSHIQNILSELYCVNKPIKSTNQIYYHPAYECVRDKIDTVIFIQVKNSCSNHKSKIEIENPMIELFIINVCRMASALRQGFVHSDVVAKAKSTEHWIERMPIFAASSLMIFTMKLIMNIYVVYTTSFSYICVLDTVVSLMVCGVAIFMVYMRVPQSICAEAKRAASDTYIQFKTNLHLMFLNSSEDHIYHEYFNQVTKNFVSGISSDKCVFIDKPDAWI